MPIVPCDEDFSRLGADDGTDALRSDLHDLARFFCGGDHFNAVGGGVRHRLFAIDRLARADGIDDDLLVPVIRHGGENAVDLFVVEKLFVFSRGEEIRLSR